MPVKCNAGDVCSAVTGECVEPADNCEPIDDDDPCTTDGCDPDSGQPVNTPKSCDDEIDETVDSCDAETGDCQHVFTCGNCADDDACTADGCDGNTGECTHEEISCGAGLVCEGGTCERGPCDDNLDCNDRNPCSLDTCVVATGECEHRDNSDAQCNDHKPETRDLCRVDVENPNGLGYACDNLPTTCQVVDDRNACTVDACDTAGNPINRAISCDDGNAATDDACNPGNGVCVYTPRCGPGTVFDQDSGMCLQGESAGPDGCANGAQACRFLDGVWGVATCQNGTWVTTQQCPQACIEGLGCANAN